MSRAFVIIFQTIQRWKVNLCSELKIRLIVDSMVTVVLIETQVTSMKLFLSSCNRLINNGERQPLNPFGYFLRNTEQVFYVDTATLWATSTQLSSCSPFFGDIVVGSKCFVNI